MSVKNDSHPTVCATCGNPARLTCSGCASDSPDVLEIAEKIYYCNAECQKTDRSNHKAECNRRRAIRALYRAGDLAREAFYIWREHMNMIKVIGVDSEKDGSLLLVVEAFCVTALYKSFNPAVFKNPSEQVAALSFTGCIEAVTYFSPMLEAMVQNMISPMSAELNLTLLEPPCPTSLYFPALPAPKNRQARSAKCKHHIFALILNSGEKYAVDLSGAQFGIQKSVMPWQDYAMNYKAVVHEVDLFGSAASHPTRITMPVGHEASRVDRMLLRCELLVIPYLYDAIVKWENKNAPLHTLAKLPKEAFTKQKESVLAAVREGVSKGFAKLHARNGPLIQRGGLSVAKDLDKWSYKFNPSDDPKIKRKSPNVNENPTQVG